MTPHCSPLNHHFDLNKPLDCLHGVGPKMLPKFHKLGLKTIEDALYHLPVRYEDRRQFKKISQLKDNVFLVAKKQFLSVKLNVLPPSVKFITLTLN